MARATLDFHPDAVIEGAEARAWCAEQNAVAAVAFVRELDSAVEAIVEQPSRWPRCLYGTRRCLLRRFPYAVVYREKPGSILGLRGRDPTASVPPQRGPSIHGGAEAGVHPDRIQRSRRNWAPADGTLEVDFLLSRGKEFLALEVKYGESVQPQHLRGLRAIADLPGVERRMLVYRGARRLRLQDGIEAVPLESFLALVREGKL
jgi:plasmid stabilization system protein ParE